MVFFYDILSVVFHDILSVTLHFFKQKANVGQWVDLMIRCNGPIVPTLMGVFYSDVATERFY